MANGGNAQVEVLAYVDLGGGLERGESWQQK